MKESEHQKLIWKWAKQHPICCDFLFSIPNGGTRHIKEIANLKAQGLRPGVSDMFLAFPTSKYCGLWIELKKDRKCYLTPDQIGWLERMIQVGYEGKVAYGHEDAISFIEEYLKTTS